MCARLLLCIFEQKHVYISVYPGCVGGENFALYLTQQTKGSIIQGFHKPVLVQTLQTEVADGVELLSQSGNLSAGAKHSFYQDHVALQLKCWSGPHTVTFAAPMYQLTLGHHKYAINHLSPHISGSFLSNAGLMS